MPKVTQYQEGQVATRVAPQPQAANAPAAAFGGQIGRAVAGSALQLQQAGARMQGRIDVTAAESANTAFQRAKNDLFFNQDTGYFKKQGRSAYDASGATSDSLNALQKQYGEGLSEGAAKRYKQVTDLQVTSGRADISRHSAKGIQAWEISSAGATIENAGESIALYHNDPEKTALHRALGEQAIIKQGRLMGSSAEEIQENIETFNSTAEAGAIQATVQSSGATAGQERLDRAKEKGLLEAPDLSKLESLVSRQKKIEHTEYVSRQSVISGTALARDYIDDPTKMQEEIDKIRDPDLRAATAREAWAQRTRIRTGRSQEAADAYDAASDATVGDDPVTVDEYKAQNAEAWERMTPTQRRMIENHTKAITDWTLYDDLDGKARDGLLTEEEVSDNAHRLAPTQRKELLRTNTTAQGKGTDAEKQQAGVGQTLNNLVTSYKNTQFGPPAGRNKEQAIAANAWHDNFNRVYQTEVARNDGNPLSTEDLNTLLADYTREHVREIKYWPDAKLNLKTATPEDYRTARAQLSRLGLPVTGRNITLAADGLVDDKLMAAADVLTDAQTVQVDAGLASIGVAPGPESRRAMASAVRAMRARGETDFSPELLRAQYLAAGGTGAQR